MKEVTKKVDAVLEKIETNDITTTNDLMYAGAAVVTDLVGVKRGNRQTRKEPWWKRRLENQVKMLNKYLGRVNVLIQQTTVKKKHKDTLQRRYKIQQERLRWVKKEIKQRIVAKTEKLRDSVIELTNTDKIDYSRITDTDSSNS